MKVASACTGKRSDDAVEWLTVTGSRGVVGNRRRLSAGATRKNEVTTIGFALATEDVRHFHLRAIHGPAARSHRAVAAGFSVP